MNNKDDVVKELSEYIGLKKGWDGPESIPPTIEAIADSMVFLACVPGKMPIPEPIVYTDGEVGLIWKWKDAYIECNFPGNGKLIYYAIDYNGTKYSSENITIKINDFPIDLKKALFTIRGMIKDKKYA